MDDVAVGSVLRQIRHRLRLRQQDVAIRARVSRSTVSRAERGDLALTSVAAIRRIGTALEVTIDLRPRWRGADLPRLLGERHAALHAAVLEVLGAHPDWAVIPEVSFSVYGERGVIDIVAWHEATRTLLVIELKTEFVDVQALIGTVDRYRRLAPTAVRERGWVPRTVATWVVVAETRTNRRHLAANRRLIRVAFPVKGPRVRSWLRRPDGPIAALSFMPYGQQGSTRQSLTSPRRVRRA